MELEGLSIRSQIPFLVRRFLLSTIGQTCLEMTQIIVSAENDGMNVRTRNMATSINAELNPLSPSLPDFILRQTFSRINTCITHFHTVNQIRSQRRDVVVERI